MESTRHYITTVSWYNQLRIKSKALVGISIICLIFITSLSLSIHLVNKITNQSNNNLMSEDLIKLIVSSKENIESTLEIQKLNIGKALVDIFCKNLETEAEKIGLKFTKYGTLMSIDNCFIFHKDELIIQKFK